MIKKIKNYIFKYIEEDSLPEQVSVALKLKH